MRHLFLRGLTALLAIHCLPAALAAHVLVEAESFAEHGGWKLDTQFIQIMGSPYLIAHGLGQPVADAVTTVKFPKTGQYRVFVRTKDWVAQWKAPGHPGKFQVLVGGTPLPVVFGAQGADWFWQEGGAVEIKSRETPVALRDLTGFDGRCDAILFTDNADYTPENDSTPMAPWRHALLGHPAKPGNGGQYDLVVIGGGYAGTAAAVSAARMGCKVALIQDRPVLGGNGSSEIRVWPQGLTRRGQYPRIGEIVEELVDRPKQSPGPLEQFDDGRREAIVRAEKNITLFLDHHVFRVETNNYRVSAVIALDVHTGKLLRFTGAYFADCTGHATVGYLAGADYSIQQKGHMGMSNMWRWKTFDTPQAFPETPWALNLNLGDFPYPAKGAGEWFWESGFDRDPIHDLEYVRDWNLRAVFGAFNAMKNRDGRAQHLNAGLEWVAYVGGNRESRQLMGDILLTRDDIVARKVFPDGFVPTTWDIDLHYPQEKFDKHLNDNPFISRAEFDKAVDKANGYPVPYRCFYSRNVDNLFMAGRCVSVSHEALGTVRVMKTGGMIGEVVGKAASLCVKYRRTPREIYQSHLDELKELLHLTGGARRANVNAKIALPKVIPPIPSTTAESSVAKGVAADTLPGIVVDDTQAKLEGQWASGQNLEGYIGARYMYHSGSQPASARFEFQVKTAGEYEVRMSYQAHTNRAANARVTVTSVDGAREQRINQRQPAPLKPGFISLGTYEFEVGTTYSVKADNQGADGIVNVDAIQVLPRSTK